MFRIGLTNTIRAQNLQKQLTRSFNNLNPRCPPCSDSSKTKPPVAEEEDLSRFPPHIQAFKRKQIFFQQPDGKPIWLKTPGDRILSNVTFGLTGLGLVMLIHLIYTLIFPDLKTDEQKMK